MQNKKWPVISIVTVCLNSEKYLAEAMSSVVNQTYPHIEYIIVDGASTDGTLDIIEKYRDNISFVVSEPDKGIYDAFNKGSTLASGDVIYFLNSDDYLYDNTIIEQVAAKFVDQPEMDVIYGNIMTTNDRKSYFAIWGNLTDLTTLQQGLMAPPPAFFARREVYRKIGLFDLSYRSASDLDFMIKCFKDDSICKIYWDKVLAVFRIGGISTTANNELLSLSEREDIILKHFAVEIDNSPEQLNTETLCKMWLEMLLFRKLNITSALKERTIKKVAIFGTLKIALYLQEDCKQVGIEVICFLDNNIRLQGLKMGDIAIHAPDWLIHNCDQIDAILISNESDGRIGEVTTQVHALLQHDKIPLFSWKQLLAMNSDMLILPPVRVRRPLNA